MDTLIIFQIIILILSVIIHEVAHGYAALWMGDVTAKYAGRLSMNPIKHLDPFGSIILPALLVFSGVGVVFGWAKPVPYNPYNLKNQRWGELVVAIAGPISNIMLAVVIALIVRFVPFVFPPAFVELAFIAILINIFLAFFNMVPIPPLDGSKVLFNLFPSLALKIRGQLKVYGPFILLIFIFFFAQVIVPPAFSFARFLLGV
jgi:Zn-dependent protease